MCLYVIIFCLSQSSGSKIFVESDPLFSSMNLSMSLLPVGKLAPSKFKISFFHFIVVEHFLGVVLVDVVKQFTLNIIIETLLVFVLYFDTCFFKFYPFW